MLVVKPYVFKNDNKNYYKKNKIVKKYDQINPAYRANHNYDLRLIILRHGERIDQSLGHDWYDKVFAGIPSAPPQAYKHKSLPYRLPYRSNTLLYVFDPPLSRTGELQSYYKGQQLAQLGATVDYCYASPASRSILTANAILKGMNCSHIPMRLEPYLFEPMNWNSALLLLDKISPFMSTGDWKQTGYNIDQRYQRLSNYLNPYETEIDYYHRSREFFESIERHHSKILSPTYRKLIPRRHTTILIVGHASSTEMLSTIALRKQFNAKSFADQCAKVPYLHTTILERDAISRQWNIHRVMNLV
ncbi:unnamed protein product [Rotaria sp. Silwood1]|nr:unnamed protein product [Rotaria sp. Silwood1]CAF3335775.1 unnamed protein product [Rotaria sp. Silwood1]CAF3357166.1 unnamed protein product [Rotaria sp. Silwood1]CAF4501924.1 unnamed protein product [Rotaria sp. Silwood1]CAF4842416.1 unnamed protein product [Rotaria sp. Silwood1]